MVPALLLHVKDLANFLHQRHASTLIIMELPEATTTSEAGGEAEADQAKVEPNADTPKLKVRKSVSKGN